MTTDNTTPTPDKMSNEQAAKEAVFAELRELGRTEGKGKTARLRAAQLVTSKAKEGLLVETDNKRAWEEILTGTGEELVDYGGNDRRDEQQFKQRASEIKHFITLGGNPRIDGVALFEQARQRMQKLRSDGNVKSGRIWELLLSFARAQNEQPGKPLTEKQIDKAMADRAAKARAIAEKLWAVRNSLLKINEGHDLPKIYQAIDLLDAQIAAEGGTRKQKKQAKLDAAKARAEAKAKPQPIQPTKAT
jgi:hypothetical protein